MAMEEEVVSLFRALDADGNGALSYDELRRVLAALGMSEDHVRIIASSMDANRDGLVSYDEFLRWTMQEPEWAKAMNRATRVDPAGNTDRGKINAVLSRISEQIRVNGWTLETFFQFGDVDHNGFLSWEELWALIKRVEPNVQEDILQGVFNELDRDMNGWLSIRELGAALARADGSFSSIEVANANAPTVEEMHRREVCLSVLELRSQVDKMDQTMYAQGYVAQPPAQRNWSDLRKMTTEEVQAEEPLLHQALRGMLDTLQARVPQGTLRDVPWTDARAPPEMSALLAESNLLLLNRDFGLNVNRKWYKSAFGPASEDVRDKVRLATRSKVASELGLAQFGDLAKCISRWPPYAKDTKMFVDSSAFAQEANAGAGGDKLLGRYDALVAKVHADYDKDWRAIAGSKPPFWVCHMAALNVGEYGTFSDFADFATAGGLDEDRYLNSMNRIFDNMVVTSVTLSVAHLVVFPFGMGAFLRHLYAVDRRYCDELVLQSLRRRIAERFVRALCKTSPGTQLHFCLSDADKEAQCNTDAFVRALLGQAPSLKGRATIWPDGDSLQLAHELAQTRQSVMLANGANRKLIGNHWFGRHAKRAIDENLHRRSWTMSALSYVVNDFSTDRCLSDRQNTELRMNVEWMGGQTFMV